MGFLVRHLDQKSDQFICFMTDKKMIFILLAFGFQKINKKGQTGALLGKPFTCFEGGAGPEVVSSSSYLN